MITNKTDISLALAVWLLNDDYDYINVENYISATTLMKPLRHVVLPPRLEPGMSTPPDVADFAARAMGTAIHDSVEKAWTGGGYRRSLKLLGYPETVIDRIQVNPSDEERRASNSMIPVYLEQRAFREIEVGNTTWTVGGKFDLVADGICQDTKSTSAYTWLLGGKDDDYRRQMSLYRWIDAAQPLRKITEDYGQINFIFTDWQKAQARQNPKYPQSKVEKKEIPLYSLKETEAWVADRLSQIQKHRSTPEPLLPECSDEDLWRSQLVHKYYADPAKTARSTRNFDDLAEARRFMAEKGGKGVIKTVPGEPKRCSFCEAFPICSQKDRYFTP